jgi:hypothetical protein
MRDEDAGESMYDWRKEYVQLFTGWRSLHICHFFEERIGMGNGKERRDRPSVVPSEWLAGGLQGGGPVY